MKSYFSAGCNCALEIIVAKLPNVLINARPGRDALGGSRDNCIENALVSSSATSVGLQQQQLFRYDSDFRAVYWPGHSVPQASLGLLERLYELGSTQRLCLIKSAASASGIGFGGLSSDIASLHRFGS